MVGVVGKEGGNGEVDLNLKTVQRLLGAPRP